MSNLLKCKPRQARKFIIECLEAGLVPFLQSSPGMGKSSIVRSISQDFQLHLIDHRVNTSEPTDATGLPRFDENGYAYFAPFKEIFPLKGMQVPKNKRGWLLFMDEFNAAPRQTQAAHYKVVLDRMIGQHHLHEDVAMVLAGNLTTDRAVVNQLSTAMQSRLVHLELKLDFLEWLEDVALPQKYDSRIIAFLSQFNDRLMDFKPEHKEHTFCCPRTWEFVNRLISRVEEDGTVTQKPVTDETAVLLTGTITSGVALEFVQFTKVYANMISVKDILKDPLNTPVPYDNNLKWAVITHVMELIDDKNFDALATYIDRFELSFRLLFYRFLLVRKKDLRMHKDFGKHISKISQYLAGTP
jgi:hypothetical protein